MSVERGSRRPLLIHIHHAGRSVSGYGEEHRKTLSGVALGDASCGDDDEDGDEDAVLRLSLGGPGDEAVIPFPRGFLVVGQSPRNPEPRLSGLSRLCVSLSLTHTHKASLIAVLLTAHSVHRSASRSPVVLPPLPLSQRSPPLWPRRHHSCHPLCLLAFLGERRRGRTSATYPLFKSSRHAMMSHPLYPCAFLGQEVVV